MHLKFGDFVLYTPIYRLTEQKKRFYFAISIKHYWKKLLYSCSVSPLSTIDHEYKGFVLVYFQFRLLFCSNKRCMFYISVKIILT